jgi:hypothetical protein
MDWSVFGRLETWAPGLSESRLQRASYFALRP